MILVGDLGILTFPRQCFLVCQIGIISQKHLCLTTVLCRQGSFVFIYIYLIFNSARPTIDMYRKGEVFSQR